VANREAFDTYLTGALPTGSLAIAEIRHIVDSLADPGELRRVLGAHEADAIDGLLRQVYPHLGDLSAGTVESALPVLAEQQSRLEPLEGALRSPAAALQTFMSALVSHVPAGDERDGMLVRFFNDQPSLSDRLLVWDLARGSDDYGRDVVRPATLDWMLEKLTELLLETTPAVLAAESRLRDLLQVCVHHAAPLRRDEVRAVLEDDNVFLTFLVNSLALAVPHERHVFAWKPVADALGGDWLRSRLGEVRSVPDASSPEGEVYRLAIEWAATSVTDRETGSAATPTEGAT
jgi:hypothetical protein